MKRVVVSGIGLVTSIGSTLETFWHGLMTRTSALSPLKKSDYTALGCTSPISAGKVEISASVIESLTFGRNKLNGLAFKAAQLAIQDASIDLDSKDIRERIGTVISNQSSQLSPQAFYSHEINKDSYRSINTELYKHLSLVGPSINISKGLDLKGPTLGAGAGVSSISFGLSSIIEGDADIMIVGSSSLFLHPYYVNCPEFKGKSLSDGAAVLVLEELNHALKRRARIYGEVKSVSISTDQDRYSGIQRSIDLVCNQSSLSLSDLSLGSFELKEDCPNEFPGIQTTYEDFFGHMPDGLGLIQSASTLLIMQNKLIPLSLSSGKLKPFSNLQNSIVTSTGLGGSVSSVIFSSLSSN